MRWMLRAFGLAVALSGVACSSVTQEEQAAVPAVALETLAVAPVAWPKLRRWDGSIEAVERATLAAQTGGRVAELPFDVGDVVDEGTVMVRFTAVEQHSGQHQAQAALAAARAAAIEARATFHRIRDIHARKLVARAELDRAQAAHDAAQAQLAAARAALKAADEQVGYTAIRAPYRGVVTARHVEPGETVSPGQPLLSGLSLDRLRLVVALPPAVAQQITPQTPAFIATDDGRRFRASRVTVFPQADAASHTVDVRLDLAEGDTGLMPGMSAGAEFQLEESAVLAVPASALAVRGEVASVFVLQDDGRVVLRQVRIGRRLDDGVEILAGLEAGEQVAIDAAAALQARREQRMNMAAN